MSKAQVSAYLVTVRQWWIDLQPDWRAVDTWPLAHEGPDGGDEDWTSLCRAGPNGLFLVVLAIGLGLANSRGVIAPDTFHLMADVTWVLETIVTFFEENPAKRPRKRGATEPPSDSPAKRRRVTQPIGGSQPAPSRRRVHSG